MSRNCLWEEHELVNFMLETSLRVVQHASELRYQTDHDEFQVIPCVYRVVRPSILDWKKNGTVCLPMPDVRQLFAENFSAELLCEHEIASHIARTIERFLGLVSCFSADVITWYSQDCFIFSMTWVLNATGAHVTCITGVR